jgi:hypothetical protein
MTRSRARRIAILGLVLATSAAAATGITYAATTTTTKVVYACANNAGTLKLLSNGHCPTGFSKVGINKTGARGPRGPRGATGPAGPGTVTLRAASTSSTPNSVSKAIPGLGLTVTVSCSADSASTVAFKDSTASADYTVAGSYQFADTGADGAYDANNSGHFLATGLGTVDFTQAKQVDAVSDFLVTNQTGAGGTLTADLTVQRGTKRVLVHFALHNADSSCFAQLDFTPSA